MERTTLFCEILLPLPVHGTFTYRVPFDLNDQIKPGMRAVVQFGAKKVYAGLVKTIHSKPPAGFQAKYILSLLDSNPVVNISQFRFWEWIASYYMCAEGEVMNAALPPAMKLSGETKIQLNPLADLDSHEITEKEYALLQAISNKKQLTISESIAVAGLPKVLPLLKNMVDKGLISLYDGLEDPWQPHAVKYVKLSASHDYEDLLKKTFDHAEKKAPRQLEVLVNYVRLSRRYETNQSDVSENDLIKSVKGGKAALQALVKKGVFEIYWQKVSRFEHLQSDKEIITFNKHQEVAWNQILNHLQTHDVTLLHGVTSSGKTEIYIKLIRKFMDEGKQVLYLLPEIALTAQIIDRLQRHFGNRAGVYHSRFSAGERLEVWNNILAGGVESLGEQIVYDLVLGPRSALFLPFRNLGMIIVDEEHEPTFKQYDPAPRYNARDAAIYLAKMLGAKVLLGSATPSVETYFNAKSVKYGYVELLHRHGGVLLPQIFVSDLRKETLHKKMKSHFSGMLHNSIQEALENKEQVILFQNRRGFSLRLECQTCNWVPECRQCDVSLVYHKKINKLKCHYCGFTEPPPSHCRKCSSPDVRMKGFGTEKIEEELPVFFPDAKIARMDLDTTRSKNSYQTIISDFGQRKIDILVGTQMVSKGLDFDNVAVVGIMNADNLLSFPDFRAHERGFQLMAQVSGRAGRSTKQGKVIIQTWNPQNSVINQVVEHDYESMYQTQIEQRQQFQYPPFVRLVNLRLLHRDQNTLSHGAEALANSLKNLFPKKVLGPEFPVIERIRNLYIKTILVKIDRGPELAAAKESIMAIIEEFKRKALFKSIRVVVDVDPA